mgnify:CR=1 FL=1|tara:strand:+ start:1109 stop:1873 length:765 start_codon:yes stop_codon:yes gene_type:complete
MRLEGKVALITGAARGIGAASATRYVEEGAKVVVADRRMKDGEVLTKKLNKHRPNCAIFVELDVTNEIAWKNAVEKTIYNFGGLNILVNNAGMIRVLPLEKTDLDMFTKVINTNLIGTFLGVKAVIKTMKDNGGGSIINFSSIQGLEGRENMSAYTASKFGVRGLTKTAAIELGEYEIRVNAVIPGPTRTKMTERKGWSEDDYNKAYGNYPLKRMAAATEIAEMVVFLGSDESSFCTGGDYVVDGGVSVGKPKV